MARRAMTAAIGGAVLLGLAGCEEVSGPVDPALVADNPGAARALRACPRAISRETSTPVTGITLNSDIVIVEVNQYIFEVDGQERPWTCVTNNAGAPQFLYPTRVIR